MSLHAPKVAVVDETAVRPAGSGAGSTDRTGGEGSLIGAVVLVGCLVLTGCLVLVGCGGARTAPARPLADRVCDGAQSAAAGRLGYPVRLHVADRDPANLDCVLHGRRLRVEVVSQASAQAYAEWNTTTSHQEQVYGPGVHEPGRIPSVVTIPGSVVAVWIRAQREIVATDATPTRGGAYVTVTVTGRPARSPTPLALAEAVTRAAFAAHPDGTS